MSRFEIKMPKLGESITEGTIVSWSVKVGESVQEDDVLFEVNLLFNLDTLQQYVEIESFKLKYF